MENLCTLKLAKRRRKDGTELHLGGGKTVYCGVWVAKRRHGAAFGLRKDGTELHLGCEKTVCGSISPAITRHGAAFGRWKDGTRRHLSGGKTARSCIWATLRLQKNGMRHNVCGNRSFTTFSTSNGDAFPTVRQNTFPCKKSTLHIHLSLIHI